MESLKSTKEIVKFCEERGVEMIHLWFVDILGQLKSVGITLRVLGEALEEGVGIDGSSVEGCHAMLISGHAPQHELGSSQREIDLKYRAARRKADQPLTYRYVVKEIARQGGY